ncbi:MAG: putative esterase [Acidobacteriales bacterium]|nr:putative esterase [Terriglobales bacterium]
MIRFPALVGVLLLSLSGSAIAASSRVECGNVKSTYAGRPVQYCALLPPSYDSSATTNKVYPVLYLLHGLGQDSQSLISDGIWNLVDDLQDRKAIGEFVIITPNAGNSFYVNAKSGKPRYEDFFIREFLPAMEHKYRIGNSRASRAISGISMGGYGALRFAFKYPQMFSSVSAHSAALMEQLPKSAVAVGLGRFIGPAFGVPLDVSYWKSNSPFVPARTAQLNGIKIYFDCGDHDDYGFEGGAASLHRLLTDRRVPHEFHIYPGGHDWSYFSEHLPASLEFHSKVFGLVPAK